MPKIKENSRIRPKEGTEGGRVPRRPRSVAAQHLDAGDEDQPKYSLHKTPSSSKPLRKVADLDKSDDVIPRRSRGRPRKVPEAQFAPDKLENVTPRRSVGIQRKRSYSFKNQATEPRQKQKKLRIQKIVSELLKGDAAKESSGKQEEEKEEQEETKSRELLRKVVDLDKSDEIIPRRSRGRPRKAPEAQSAPDKLENATPRRSVGIQRKRSYPYKFQATELLKGDAAKDSSGKQEEKKEEQEETKEPPPVRKARSDAIQRLAAVYEDQPEDDIVIIPDRAKTRVSHWKDPDIGGAVGKKKEKKEDKQKMKPAVLAGNVFPRRSVGRPRKSEDVRIIGLLKEEAGNGEEIKEQKEMKPAVPARAETVLPRRSVGRPRKAQDLKDIGLLKEEAANKKKEEVKETRVTRSKGPIIGVRNKDKKEDKHKAKPASVKTSGILKDKPTVPAKASTVFLRRSVGRPRKNAPIVSQGSSSQSKEVVGGGGENLDLNISNPPATAMAQAVPSDSAEEPKKNSTVKREEKMQGEKQILLASKGTVHPGLILCSACSMHFLNPYGPMAHISSSQLLYSHLERDHGIPMCSCGSSFPDDKSLRDHEHVICDVCRNDLPPDQAADHKRSHAAKEWDCAKCHEKFTSFNTLKDHLPSCLLKETTAK